MRFVGPNRILYTEITEEEAKGDPIAAENKRRADILASSYLNFLVTNGVVLAQKFWKEGRPEAWRQRDEQARKTLQQVFPDRRVIAFDASAINVGGGGIHCNTQQVPKAR